MILRQRGLSVTGYERNPEAVRIGRERGLDIVECDFTQLSLPTKRFDSIVLSHVLEHAPDPVDLLRRCLAGLKPSGRLFVQVPNLDSPARVVFRGHWHGWDVPVHLWHFNANALERTLAAAGAGSSRVVGHGSADDWTRSIWKMLGGRPRLLLVRALLMIPVISLEKIGVYSAITAVASKKT